jgi:thiol-disulfide isomerase/thioredoxin
MDMRQRLLAFSLGLLVLGIVFGLAILGPSSAIIAFVCNDARLFYALGAMLLLGAGVWLGARAHSTAWSAILLWLPLGAAFAMSTLRDLPFMWPTLPLWILSAAVGIRLLSPTRQERLWTGAGAVLLSLVSLWFCGRYIPSQIGAEMSRVRDNPEPVFTFQPVNDRSAPLKATPGKVLVIDFAQTWCAPCRAELPEIARLKDDLKDRKDIQFVLVATDAQGDTPEKFGQFAARQHIDLPLAFDPGGKARAAFGVHGFPSVVVLDRDGRVRFTHEGYNSAETNFRRDLSQLLRTL